MKVSNLGDMLAVSVKALIARHNYARALQRLRQEAPRRKIKVAFFVSELEKWKGQSVFDELKSSSGFDPFVVVMNLPQHKTLPRDEQLRIEEEKAAYFRNRGMPVVRFESDRWSFDADIVFYQQPWGIPRKLKPFSVSRRALTFYFPYYTPNVEDVERSACMNFHRLVYSYIVFDQAEVDLYREFRRKRGGLCAGSMLPLGHPAFDDLHFDLHALNPQGNVIYAPHWSVSTKEFHPVLPYSTFQWSGRAMLAFAQAHPEVKWAFKPHPKLKSSLVESGLMTSAEANGYYAAWARIGETCYAGPSGYIDLFRRSRAMITDCGSFLSEYGQTGRPVIHLVSDYMDRQILPSICGTYYRVRTPDELASALDEILVRGADAKRAERIKILEDGISKGRSTDRIINWMNRLLSPPPPGANEQGDQGACR